MSQQVNTQISQSVSYNQQSPAVPEHHIQQQQQQAGIETSNLMYQQQSHLQTAVGGLQLQQMGPTGQAEPMGATPFNCPILPHGSMYPMGPNEPMDQMGGNIPFNSLDQMGGNNSFGHMGSPGPMVPMRSPGPMVPMGPPGPMVPMGPETGFDPNMNNQFMQPQQVPVIILIILL